MWPGKGSLPTVFEPLGTGSDIESKEGWLCLRADLMSCLGALADLTTSAVGLMVGLGCHRTMEHRPQILVMSARPGSRAWTLWFGAGLYGHCLKCSCV